MSTRMTKVDWDILNDALTLLESYVEDEPTGTYSGRPFLRIQATHRKVWERRT